MSDVKRFIEITKNVATRKANVIVLEFKDEDLLCKIITGLDLDLIYLRRDYEEKVILLEFRDRQ